MKGRLRLNRALMLEARGQESDGAGGFVEGWQPLGQLWAGIRPGAVRMQGGGAGAVSTLGLRAILRAAPAGDPARPRPGQRFREGGRIYAILAVSESDASGRWLICHLREEQAR